MRILIDATPLLLRSAGVKNYTYYWIQSLWEQARNDRILTLPALASLGPLNHERSVARVHADIPAPGPDFRREFRALLAAAALDHAQGRRVPCLESDPVSSQEH